MIAISLTAHENPRVVMELLSNIKFCYNGNAFLVVHVSADHKEAFFRHAAAKGIRLFDERIFWNDIEIGTRWGNTLPMQIWNYLYLKTKVRQSFTHFQIISPSNLIIQGDLDLYVQRFDIVMRKTIPAGAGWVWTEAINADARYEQFRQANGIARPLAARVDGLAVRDEIFGDFARRLLKIYSIADMQSVDPVYPLEETILPSFLETQLQFGCRLGDGRAKTFEPNEPQPDVPTVQRLMQEGQIAYLKRVPPQEDDPVRQFILRRMSYGR
jgi:hypothetical protein